MFPIRRLRQHCKTLPTSTHYQGSALIPVIQVSGSTDGAIVLFGAPGTHVTGNTIISSPTDSGFGAINMVDDLSTYNGSFSGVVVSNNVITGQKLFAAGIAMGSCVWGGSCDGAPLSGPATITDNTFAGNITFPMAINRWTGGLTVML